MTDDERELLLAVAEAVAHQDGTSDDVRRGYAVRVALDRYRAGPRDIIDATEKAEC